MEVTENMDVIFHPVDLISEAIFVFDESCHIGIQLTGMEQGQGSSALFGSKD